MYGQRYRGVIACAADGLKGQAWGFQSLGLFPFPLVGATSCAGHPCYCLPSRLDACTGLARVLFYPSSLAWMCPLCGGMHGCLGPIMVWLSEAGVLLIKRWGCEESGRDAE